MLFAPVARQEALFALYAFNYEIARARESVTQPMLGQIRLQWWRENIAAAFEGGGIRQHPVVEAITATIREFGLTRDHFDGLIDARETDLADEPPASLAALEEYAESTSATLVYVALEVLGMHEPAAREAGLHVGVAYSLAGLLRAMPFRERQIIPADIPTPYGVTTVAAAGLRHLQAARALRNRIPRSALPALLPAIIAQQSLARLKQAGNNPFDPTLATPDPLQSWRLAVAALFNRF